VKDAQVLYAVVILVEVQNVLSTL